MTLSVLVRAKDVCDNSCVTIKLQILFRYAVSVNPIVYRVIKQR
jgi:hypothetical protein